MANTMAQRQLLAQFMRDAITLAVRTMAENPDQIPEELRETIEEIGQVEVHYDDIHPNTLYMLLPDGSGWRTMLQQTHPAPLTAKVRAQVPADGNGERPRRGGERQKDKEPAAAG